MERIVLPSGEYGDTLERVHLVLRDGGIAVVPTDTVYGVIGDARDERVIERIFRMKARSHEKPLSLFVRNWEMACEWAIVPPRVRRFLELVWPGAVTVALRIKGTLSPVLTGGGDTIGMRVPAYPFLLDLLREFGFPLAQTSANISGEPAARSFEEVVRYFDGRSGDPDTVVDGGAVPGVASTVVDVTGAFPRVLREGALTKENIERLWEYAVG